MEEAKAARLRDAMQHRCVSAWLGHGAALFLGFGDEVLPRAGGDAGPRPSYKLDTNYAGWRVDGPITAVWTDDEGASSTADLRAAAESLVGETVESWQLLEDAGLRISFTSAKVLTIEPWPVSDGVADAWSLSAPDGFILAASNDGRTVIVEADMPIHRWFT